MSNTVNKRFCFGDFVLMVMIIVPLSIFYTGVTNFHIYFFASSFIGYGLAIHGAVRWKNWRWYADV